MLKPKEKSPGFPVELACWIVCVLIALLGWPPEESRAYWGAFIGAIGGPPYLYWKYFRA